MRQKIAILGSTGSIGKSLLEIINKDRNKFEVVLLTANKNHSDLIKQAKKYNVKILPDDHPIYQEPPTIIVGPSIRNKKKK